MNDLHIRSILLAGVGAINIGASIVLKMAGFATAPSLMGVVALTSFFAAILMLCFGQIGEGANGHE